MIKKTILALLMIAANLSSAQEKEAKPSVENNLWGASIGLIEGNLHYETKLTRLSTLRLEAGTRLGSYTYTYFNGTTLEDQTETIMPLVLTAEPIFYYNLDRRSRLGKNTDKNTGNYFSLRTSFGFYKNELYNSNKSRNVSEALFLIPKYGMRRSFAKNFFYEFGFGMGWQHNTGDLKKKNDLHVDITARIGVNL